MILVPLLFSGAELAAHAGSGVPGWGTEEEEDLWHVDFEIPGEVKHDIEDEMSVGELMELRYMQAEREKEQVCDHLPFSPPMHPLS